MKGTGNILLHVLSVKPHPTGYLVMPHNSRCN